jgi:hypothetical protein
MDGLARLVHNVTGPVENIMARIIRAVHEESAKL